MRYRSEIDGLRALAVVPVILFHAGIPLVSGGYVGVDIFFVISGYLITSIILSELEQGKFSIITFYERRARRILPALFLVMAVCLPFAWMWLIPSEFKDFSVSIIGVILFSSNIVFWQTSGYFETATELKPLLHTWSLAVEEQYYVVFPVFLLLVWRFGRRWTASLIGIVVLLSLVCAHLGAFQKPIATFYLLPTRAWELGMGALAAIYLAREGRVDVSQRACQLFSLLGLILIVGSIFFYDQYTPFPSLYTLVPTVGSVLIILFAGTQTLAGSLLARKPMVWIGLISYSAYLWHQPLFALARHRSYHEPGLAVFSLLSVLSLVLGYLSWRYVEAPFRNKERVARAQVFTLSAAGMAIFLAIGAWGVMSDGFRQRDKWKGIENGFQTQAERGSGDRYCAAHRIESPLGPITCIIGDTSQKPEGVLWGDSYAGALLIGLHEELKRQGRAFYAVLSDGCVPVENAWLLPQVDEFGCTKDRQSRLVHAVLQDPSIRKVIWIGGFSGVLKDMPSRHMLIDGVPASSELTKRKMLATMKKFKEAGKDVVLVGETPRFSHFAADYAIRRYAATGGNADAVRQQVARETMIASLNQSDLLAEAGAFGRVVNALDLFCDQQRCETHDAQGRLLYIDKNHISHLGASRLAGEVINRFEDRVDGTYAAVASGAPAREAAAH